MAHVPKKEIDMSSYKEGQTHQLANALEAAGYTKDDLTRLGQFPHHPLILGVLRGTHEIVGKDLLRFKETDFLRPVAMLTFPARTEPFNANEWYRNRKGLCVRSTLMDHFDLDIVETTLWPSLKRIYVAFELKEEANSAIIQAELLGQRLQRFLTLEDIATLIDAQWSGSIGILQTQTSNNYNFSYVKGKDAEEFVVTAYWHDNNDNRREWEVGDRRPRTSVPWGVGTRFICSGNVVFQP
ncbi:MAG TPA: hypothetical protein VN420_03655 [Candidatus Fimivivens sp.]|nr:hypothetical protein [Candidatus Fimivivens sp.]